MNPRLRVCIFSSFLPQNEVKIPSYIMRDILPLNPTFLSGTNSPLPLTFSFHRGSSHPFAVCVTRYAVSYFCTSTCSSLYLMLSHPSSGLLCSSNIDQKKPSLTHTLPSHWVNIFCYAFNHFGVIRNTIWYSFLILFDTIICSNICLPPQNFEHLQSRVVFYASYPYHLVSSLECNWCPINVNGMLFRKILILPLETVYTVRCWQICMNFMY